MQNKLCVGWVRVLQKSVKCQEPFSCRTIPKYMGLHNPQLNSSTVKVLPQLLFLRDPLGWKTCCSLSEVSGSSVCVFPEKAACVNKCGLS